MVQVGAHGTSLSPCGPTWSLSPSGPSVGYMGLVLVLGVWD